MIFKSAKLFSRPGDYIKYKYNNILKDIVMFNIRSHRFVSLVNIRLNSSCIVNDVLRVGVVIPPEELFLFMENRRYILCLKNKKVYDLKELKYTRLNDIQISQIRNYHNESSVIDLINKLKWESMK